MRLMRLWFLLCLVLGGFSTTASAQALLGVGECPEGVVDFPNVLMHVEQSDLHAGLYDFQTVFQRGAGMGELRWNECDGQGRPETTGGIDKRAPGQPNMTRVSGPEATSCFGCHAQPRSGGAGDFVANTFNGAENLDPITESIDASLSNQRNTTGMFGAGYLELLAREMTAELQSQAQEVLARGIPGWHTLTTKGVSFDIQIRQGAIVATRGIDTDLIVKPFGAGGTVASLRQFTVNALNRHHGIQAEERFDLYLGDPDYDGDGKTRELSVGDVTELTIWQATLDRPLLALPPDDETARQKILNGQDLFAQIGCAGCHTPKMTLNNRTFCEPGKYNPPGYYQDQSQLYCTVLDYSARDNKKTDDPTDKATRTPPPANTPLVLHTYTDLKRHTLCDRPDDPAPVIRDLCDEQLAEDRPDQDGIPGQEFFLTADLWQVAESGPWGHNGLYNSLSSIIKVHGGEGHASRDAYLALTPDQQKNVLLFLRALQIKDQFIRVNNG
jgi:mono/diheme cytochrome c family protein